MPLIIGTTNIGDIYKGTTKIDSVYKGTTLVYTSGTWEQYLYEFIYYSLVPQYVNQTGLPNTYQQVEYIESSGTQYIDTGFKPNQDTTISIDIQMLSVANTQGIFGVGDTSLSKSYRIGVSSNGYFYVAIKGTQYNGANSTSDTNRNLFEIKNNALYKNGSVYATITDTSSFQCENNAYIFYFGGSTTITKASAKLYSCKIYDNGTLVRDFVPCYRKSDNVIGIYDLVNNVFYTNQGTGTFTKGNDVLSVKNRARVNTIYGNSVVENQLVENGNFESTNGWYSINATNSASNNTFTITKNSVDTTYVYRANASFPTVVENHYYLCSVYIKPSGNSSWRFRVGNNYGTALSIVANNKTRLVQIMHPTSLGGFYSSVSDDQGQLASGGTCEFSEYEMIDLTQMFPINTPTTLTDNRVQALLNRGYIPYNTGSIKRVEVSAISSEPYNLFDGEFENGDIDSSTGVETSDSRFERSKNYIEVIGGVQYSLEQEGTIASWQYAQRKICQFDINFNFIRSNTGYNNASQFLNPYNLTLQNNCRYIRMVYYKTGEGTWNNVCFRRTGTRTGYAPHTNPQTLSFKYQGSGVGTAHDTLEITSSAYVFTKNMNRVDLGSLNYTLASNSYFTTIISDMLLGEINSTLNNSLCEKYPVYSNLNRGDYTDKGINYGYTGGGFSIRIKDTSISTDNPTTFKSGLANTKFEYQLATPQVISIPRKHLKVIDLGSLEWNVGSTNYGFASFGITTTYNAKPVASNNSQANIYCANYKTDVANNITGQSVDMSIAINYSGSLLIRDTSKLSLTASQFKSAMSGIYLFYETENEVADIDTKINVEAGGTLTTNWFSWKKNNLFKSYLSPNPTTNNNLTFTRNTNTQSITINGTASAFTQQGFGGSNPLTANHYYLLFCDKQPSGVIVLDGNGTLGTTTNGAYIGKPNSNIAFSPRFEIQNGTVLNNVEINVMLIDLTFAFGSGNEPTNVNDPRAQYIINQGYIPSDTTGTDTLVDSQVLPNLLMEIKCK